MKIVICKECKKERVHKAKGMCSACYSKIIQQTPKYKAMQKEHREKNKEKYKAWGKKWRKENKYRRRHDEKERRDTDKEFRILDNLRSRLSDALKKFTRTGKIATAREYGIDYKAIIEHLKPFPKVLSAYHIDHIKPLHTFNLKNPEEVKKAFAPENHQWLNIEEHFKKTAEDRARF